MRIDRLGLLGPSTDVTERQVVKGGDVASRSVCEVQGLEVHAQDGSCKLLVWLFSCAVCASMLVVSQKGFG